MPAVSLPVRLGVDDTKRWVLRAAATTGRSCEVRRRVDAREAIIETNALTQRSAVPFLGRILDKRGLEMERKKQRFDWLD